MGDDLDRGSRGRPGDGSERKFSLEAVPRLVKPEGCAQRHEFNAKLSVASYFCYDIVLFWRLAASPLAPHSWAKSCRPLADLTVQARDREVDDRGFGGYPVGLEAG
jgi:hypothetical protein